MNRRQLIGSALGGLAAAVLPLAAVHANTASAATNLATAGGLTSGIDLALHVVARYFEPEAAARTARYMEHESRIG